MCVDLPFSTGSKSLLIPGTRGERERERERESSKVLNLATEKAISPNRLVLVRAIVWSLMSVRRGFTLGRGAIAQPQPEPCPQSLFTVAVAVVKPANSYTGGRFFGGLE